MRKAVRRKPSPQPPAGRVMRRPQPEASVQDRVGMRRSREMRAGPPPSAGGMSGGSGIVRRACGATCTCAPCREEESGTQGSKGEGKSAVEGKSVFVLVVLGGSRNFR